MNLATRLYFNATPLFQGLKTNGRCAVKIARPTGSGAFLVAAFLFVTAVSAPVRAQTPIDIAVVFTPAAIQTIESSEFGSIDTREEWIDKHIDWANDGLDANDLDDNAEFVAVNAQTQGAVINIIEGSQTMGEFARIVEDNLSNWEVINGQSISNYLQSLNADVLLIVMEHADPGEYGYGLINVKNPVTGAMTSHQVVVVDASVTSDLDNIYVELIVLHELLHNMGVFDNSGFRTSYECSVETRPQQCDFDREPTDNIHDGMYETFPQNFCTWIDGYVGDLLEPILEGLDDDEDGLTVCEYLAILGWGGNRQFVENHGIPIASGISGRLYFTGGGGGGGGGSPPIVPSPPNVWAYPRDCQEAPIPGYPPACAFDVFWTYDEYTDYVLVYNYYGAGSWHPAWWQPAYLPPSWSPYHITMRACTSGNVCSDHSYPLILGW